MKKAKITKQKIKQEKQIETSEYSIKNLIIIIASLVVIFVVFYFITTLVVKPQENDLENNEVSEFDFSFTKILMNHLLDRDEKEYYVIATKKSESNKTNYKVIYNNYISDYKNQENSLTFYCVDLSETINKSYLGEEVNISNNITKLKITDDTLFKIKNGKIDEYFVGNKDIIKALSGLIR